VCKLGAPSLTLNYHYMQLPREVIVGNGTLQRVPEVVKRLGLKGKALVMSDTQCYELAGKTVSNLLVESGLSVDFLSIKTMNIDDISDIEKQIKAFYMKRDPENPKVALAVDVIAPEGYGEIIGGSQREDNLDLLLERIKEHNLPQSFFEWYLDLRRFGSVPHSGFGLGLERTVSWICGLEHLREAIPFPRMIYRNTP